MNTKRNLLLFSLLIIAVFLLTSCAAGQTTAVTTNQNEQTTASTKTTAATTTASSTAATTSAAGNTVSIENFAFAPDTLTVKAGTTVVWTNNDTAGHNIKSDIFTSPTLAQGETFSFKFDTAGTFEYICGVHPSMKGKIIVE